MKKPAESLFKKTVYEVVRSIPSGRVATYGLVASLAARPNAARAVGMFMRTCEDESIPCHRVVGTGGALVGYGGSSGVIEKERLLQKEGVVFKGDRVNLGASLWEPR